MLNIFIDESGDLGSSKLSTKWFLCVASAHKDPRALERIIKKFWKTFIKNHRHMGELHANRERINTRKKILTMISNLDGLEVFYSVVSKNKRSLLLGNSLYNKTIVGLIENIYKKTINEDSELNICIDRKYTKPILLDQLNKSIINSIKKLGNRKVFVKFEHSHDNKSLQAVDFISWAIFRKYEYSDDSYYNIVKNKIIDESTLYTK